MSGPLDQEVISKLKYLMASVFGMEYEESIPDDASMDKMAEWDSLAHIELLVGIRSLFDITVATDEISFTLSLPGLVSLINSKLAGAASPATQRPANSVMAWQELLDRLSVHDALRGEDTLYIHSRLKDALSLCGGPPAEVYELLRGGRNGRRTLVFPAFPFTGRSYVEYIAERPRFSVRKTASLTGLLPELMRLEKGVWRSAHPLLSEFAIGPQARWITEAAHIDPHPFHKDSTYARLMALDAAMIGLGVDINTNAVIHMVDDLFRSVYPFDIYVEKKLYFEIELADSTIEKRKFIAYSPDVLKRIKPRKLRPYFKHLPHVLHEIEINGVWFYMLRIRPFIAECIEIARRSLREGNLPPWYE